MNPSLRERVKRAAGAIRADVVVSRDTLRDLVLDLDDALPTHKETDMTAATARFTVSPDDLTAHEPARDLHWTRDDVSSERLTYDEAEEAITKLNADKFGGFDDWRLPTVEELFLLADRAKFSPAIDTDAFPTCKSEWYWTGTTDAEDPSEYAWVVDFGYGGSGLGNRHHHGRVRAVRGPARQ